MFLQNVGNFLTGNTNTHQKRQDTNYEKFISYRYVKIKARA